MSDSQIVQSRYRICGAAWRAIEQDSCSRGRSHDSAITLSDIDKCDCCYIVTLSILRLSLSKGIRRLDRF